MTRGWRQNPTGGPQVGQVDLPGAGPEHDLARSLGRACLIGIGEQIHRHLEDLGGIALDEGDPVRQIAAEGHIHRQGYPEQVGDFFGHDAQIHLLHPAFPVAGVGHQLGGEFPGLLGRLVDSLEAMRWVAALSQLQAAHFGVAHDGRDQVVEIVGDPPGQHAEGLQLLGLNDLGFQLGPIRQLLHGLLGLFGHPLRMDRRHDKVLVRFPHLGCGLLRGGSHGLGMEGRKDKNCVGFAQLTGIAPAIPASRPRVFLAQHLGHRLRTGSTSATSVVSMALHRRPSDRRVRRVGTAWQRHLGPAPFCCSGSTDVSTSRGMHGWCHMSKIPKNYILGSRIDAVPVGSNQNEGWLPGRRAKTRSPFCSIMEEVDAPDSPA